MKETLSYATPDVGDRQNPERQSAASHARGNGRGLVIFGLLFMLLTLGAMADATSHAAAPWEGFYAALFLTSGVLHALCGKMLRRPNVKWERILKITATIHMLGMLPMLWGIIRAILAYPAPWLYVVILALALVVELSLGIGLWKVLRLRRQT